MAGGLGSLAARVAISIFLLFIFIDVVKRESTVARKTVFKNLISDQTEYVFNKTNFDIAVKVNYYGV